VPSEPEEQSLFSYGSLKATLGKKPEIWTGSFRSAKMENINLACGSVEANIPRFWQPEEFAQEYAQKDPI
jgi:hypothetical protein